MNYVHEAWDSKVVDRLDDLRIGVSNSAEPLGSAVIGSIQRYGFALLCGLDKGRDREATALELVRLAGQLGRVVPQSPRGERVEDVRDFSDIEVKDDRGYRSRGELSPHSDPPTLILLHCLVPAKSGGESHLVNVRAIHDRIAARDPELLATLYQDFPRWRVEGQYGNSVSGPEDSGRPIFTQRNGLVSCVHYRPFTELSAKIANTPLSAAQVAALDLFDECANAPELSLRFFLRAGETMLLHNRTVLHARTDYEDWPEPARRRHLLRVWIDAPETFPVAPVHELGDLFEARE